MHLQQKRNEKTPSTLVKTFKGTLLKTWYYQFP
jgi:hypothetical protein